MRPAQGAGKVRPYGFVSFLDPWDALSALKEMEGEYVGLRPIRLKRANDKARSLDAAKEREREAKRAR